MLRFDVAARLCQTLTENKLTLEINYEIQRYKTKVIHVSDSVENESKIPVLPIELCLMFMELRLLLVLFTNL